MSMLATFVQLEPSLAARLNGEPELLEELFAPSLEGLFDAEGMRAAILERGPQLLAGAMDMHPQLRQLIEARAGMTQDALRQGSGGEEVLKLMGAHASPAFEGPSNGRRTLSLDKAWHGVHFVLTGAVEPDGTLVGQAVLGGTEVGEDFGGYGPARLFEPGVVAALAAALDEPGFEETAIARFDPARMTELQIYPFGWDADGKEWLLSSLRELRSFYTGAAADGLAVATCLE